MLHKDILLESNILSTYSGFRPNSGNKHTFLGQLKHDGGSYFPEKFDKWKKGEPRDGRHCAVVSTKDNNKMVSKDCGKKNYYICQVSGLGEFWLVYLWWSLWTLHTNKRALEEDRELDFSGKHVLNLSHGHNIIVFPNCSPNPSESLMIHRWFTQH